MVKKTILKNNIEGLTAGKPSPAGHLGAKPDALPMAPFKWPPLLLSSPAAAAAYATSGRRVALLSSSSSSPAASAGGAVFSPTARLNHDLPKCALSCPFSPLACFSQPLRAGHPPADAATFNVLLHCLSLGRLTDARLLFDAVRGLVVGLRSLVSCNTLAMGYCLGGRLDDVLNVRCWMLAAALRPNKRIYSTILDAPWHGLFPSIPTSRTLQFARRVAM